MNNKTDTVVEHERERPCVKCNSPVRVVVHVNAQGIIRRYVRAIDGVISEFPRANKTKQVFCNSCKTWLTEYLREQGRFCAFCDSPIYILTDAIPLVKDGKDAYACSSEKCRLAVLEERARKTAALKEKELRFHADREQWIKEHPQPNVSPVFREDDRGEADRALLLFIRSLPQDQFNVFMWQLHKHLVHSKWEASPDEWPGGETSSPFDWTVFFDCDPDKEGFDIQYIENITVADKKIRIDLPLPMCVREWLLQEKGSPLFENAQRLSVGCVAIEKPTRHS